MVNCSKCKKLDKIKRQACGCACCNNCLKKKLEMFICGVCKLPLMKNKEYELINEKKIAKIEKALDNANEEKLIKIIYGSVINRNSTILLYALIKDKLPIELLYILVKDDYESIDFIKNSFPLNFERNSKKNNGRYFNILFGLVCEKN